MLSLNQTLCGVSYSQSQTENGGIVVKVVHHFVAGGAVHLYMSIEEQKVIFVNVSDILLTILRYILVVIPNY